MNEPTSLTNITAPSVARADARDLGELLPLMRAYCEFYETARPEDQLLALSKALIEDPIHEVSS